MNIRHLKRSFFILFFPGVGASKYALSPSWLPFPFHSRSQTLNKADALEKLRAAVRTALEPPKEKFSVEEQEKFRNELF